MTPSDLRTLDTLEGPDYMDGYLSDEGSFHKILPGFDIALRCGYS